MLSAHVFDAGDAFDDDPRGSLLSGDGDAGFGFGPPGGGFASTGASTQQTLQQQAEDRIAGVAAKTPMPDGKLPSGAIFSRGLQGTMVLANDTTGHQWQGSYFDGVFKWVEPSRTSTFGQIASSVRSAVKTALPVAATIASVVPGVGTGVAFGLQAANALAQGKSLKDAALEAAKKSLPGGPAAAAAFDAATKLAQGGSLSDAAIAAARDALPGGEAAKTAFDTAINVAKGQSPTDAVHNAAISAATRAGGPIGNFAAQVAQGKNVLQAATSTAATQLAPTIAPIAQTIASRMGIDDAIDPIRSAVLAASKSGVMAAAADPAKFLPGTTAPIARALLQNDALRSLTAQQVAQKMGVPVDQVRAAMGAIVAATRAVGGGNAAPVLQLAPQVASMIGPTHTLDGALARLATKVAPVSFTPSPTKTPQIGGQPMAQYKPGRRMMQTIVRVLPRLATHPVWRAVTARAVDAGGYDAGDLTGLSPAPVDAQFSVPPTKQEFYTVRSGDYPILIASKITGSGSRYTELIDANPGKATTGTRGTSSFNFKSLLAGEHLALPQSWNQYIAVDASGHELGVTGGKPLPALAAASTTTVPTTPPTAPTGTTVPAIPGIPSAGTTVDTPFGKMTVPAIPGINTPGTTSPTIPLPSPGPPSGGTSQPLPPIIPTSTPSPAPSSGDISSGLPAGRITVLKGELGVWGQREKTLTNYPGAFDINDTVDENFRNAVRTFQQWANSTGVSSGKVPSGVDKSDGTLTQQTADAIDAYVRGIAPAVLGPSGGGPGPSAPIGMPNPLTGKVATKTTGGSTSGGAGAVLAGLAAAALLVV